MRIKSKRSGEICHSIQESLWTSVSELWPIGQPSWQPKENVITNEDLGEISKMVPTKGTVEKKKIYANEERQHWNLMRAEKKKNVRRERE